MATPGSSSPRRGDRRRGRISINRNEIRPAGPAWPATVGAWPRIFNQSHRPRPGVGNRAPATVVRIGAGAFRRQPRIWTAPLPRRTLSGVAAGPPFTARPLESRMHLRHRLAAALPLAAFALAAPLHRPGAGRGRHHPPRQPRGGHAARLQLHRARGEPGERLLPPRRPHRHQPARGRGSHAHAGADLERAHAGERRVRRGGGAHRRPGDPPAHRRAAGHACGWPRASPRPARRWW